MISFGVSRSCPGQNGQSAAEIGRIGCICAKSCGRPFRSVEMITQRPTMGSRRKSGMASLRNVRSGLYPPDRRFEVRSGDAQCGRLMARIPRGLQAVTPNDHRHL